MNRYKRLIRKSSGSIEPFSSKKLYQSIKKAGLSSKYSKYIAKEVSSKIQESTTTKEIYKHAIKLIKKKSPAAASRYSLKKCLLNLGPTGYEFEKFVAKYFEALGFETATGNIYQGKFVTHEVDVTASSGKELYYTECKFHNNSGRKIDIKIPLYVRGRWEDLQHGPDGKSLDGYFLASNSAFTKDALDYSAGIGLKLLGVNAPEEQSFLDQIRIMKLFPITSLTKLKKKYLSPLLSREVLLCSELLSERNFLLRIGMPEEEIAHIFLEVDLLLRDNDQPYKK